MRWPGRHGGARGVVDWQAYSGSLRGATALSQVVLGANEVVFTAELGQALLAPRANPVWGRELCWWQRSDRFKLRPVVVELVAAVVGVLFADVVASGDAQSPCRGSFDALVADGADSMVGGGWHLVAGRCLHGVVGSGGAARLVGWALGGEEGAFGGSRWASGHGK